MVSTKKDKIAKDWNHLQELLFNHVDKELDRFRSPFVYRGLSNKDYELKTSLSRIGTPPEQVERHLLRNFRKYAPHDLKIGENEWHWIALAQHHGLPTRLLDWTFSPYVALHFMTEELNKYDTDGAIWCVDFYEARKLLRDGIKKKLDDKSYKAFSADLLQEVCRNVDDFNVDNFGDIFLFFEPPSLDSRIVNQFALFSMMADNNATINSWLEKHDHLYFRVVVPAKMKWEIRDKLDQANITERVIYPGLDGLSSWLKRWYSQK